MSSRTVIQQVIDTNVYDNNNKEILAAMVRTVLEELMNSNFNKTDDEMQGLKYNSTQTLQQFFANVPVIRQSTIGPFDVSGGITATLAISGSTIVSAASISQSVNDSKITIDFSENISTRKFMFNYQTTDIGDEGLNRNNDVISPVWRLETATRIVVGVREISGQTQNILLNVIVI